ncbi:MAG TPA: hypothetical protein VGO37_14645 [Steroidobacteraceae bacterium]|jgi:hypothetical protein|nr:hypothetical protein [Steroidobacteraceae bacterium]
MNKALSILLVVAIAALVVPFARGVGSPSPPPGISERSWIPMGEAAGFVITDIASDFRKGLRTESSTMKGYFMARREGAWFRVDSSPDYEAHPAECPNARRSPVYGL